MKRYFLKRVGLLFVALWGITLVTFLMLQFAPGSPLEMKLAQDRGGGLSSKAQITDEVVERLKKQYNLDKPVMVRYGLWVKDIVQLDFGTSFTDHRPVIEKIKERIPVSLALGATGILVALLIGIPSGLLAAALKDSIWDRSIAVISIALYSLPAYVLGIYLLTFLGSEEFLNWFPIYGLQSTNYEELGFFEQIADRLHHFFLPALCYSIGGIAFISQQQRASILDAMGQDFIRTARAKGLSERVVFLKHAFRNSLIPILTIVGAMVPSLVGASVIIESLFSIPGLGLLMFEALLQRDYPTHMANVTILSMLSLLGIFLSDLLYVIVDPRINFEASS